jgi:hypothetical protein
MAFQVSPGINVSEINLTTVVPNVATSIGAIAGGFQWGPVLERTSITTENDLVKVFGKPDDDTAEWFLTAANYLAYSNNLLVVRNVGASAKNAVVGDDGVGTAANVNNATDYDTDTFSDQVFVAKYPGEKGNSLTAEACDSAGFATWAYKAHFDRAPGTSTDCSNAGGSEDEMHVIVIDADGQWTGTPGEVLEKHAFVSKASDAKRIDGSSNYVKNVLRNESSYIWLGLPSQLTELADDGNNIAGVSKIGNVFRVFSTGGTAYTPGGRLAGGVDDNVLSDAELQAAYALYIAPEVVDVTLIMAGPGTISTGNYIVDNITSVRKDCVAFVSPVKGSVVTAGTDQRTNILTELNTRSDSSYAFMDSAWKYQYDRYNDVFRYVPMNGDTAGLCARTDFTNDAWWSPAGLNRGGIKNIVKLSWEATKADRDILYPLCVNPLVTQKGAGVVLWGDKTMQTVPSAFDRINVRRLFIVLEKAISTAAKAMLFEFNDEFTRSQFINIVTPFLREVQGRRGVTDFKVVCDSSNNTGEIVDANNFVGDIYVKPSRSINYVQLNFIAARSDVTFSEIGG